MVNLVEKNLLQAKATESMNYFGQVIEKHVSVEFRLRNVHKWYYSYKIGLFFKWGSLWLFQLFQEVLKILYVRVDFCVELSENLVIFFPILFRKSITPTTGRWSLWIILLLFKICTILFNYRGCGVETKLGLIIINVENWYRYYINRVWTRCCVASRCPTFGHVRSFVLDRGR